MIHLNYTKEKKKKKTLNKAISTNSKGLQKVMLSKKLSMD
jgi:hypothetical protein